jgi:hypothetical protein
LPADRDFDGGGLAAATYYIRVIQSGQTTTIAGYVLRVAFNP